MALMLWLIWSFSQVLAPFSADDTSVVKKPASFVATGRRPCPTASQQYTSLCRAARHAIHASKNAEIQYVLKRATPGSGRIKEASEETT